MKNRLIRYFPVSLLLLILLHCSYDSIGQLNESGLYPLFNYTSRTYGALPQNWCAMQDHRGIMYFGNNNGVLEYDGLNWKLLAPSDGAPVHSLAADKEGRIYFGSENEFGYLVTDSTGQLNYFLLSDMLSEEEQNFDEIWETHVIDGSVYFQSFHSIFIWNGDSLQIIYSEEEINESFFVGGYLVMSFTDSGLGYLSGSQIIAIDSNDMFASNRISGMVETEDGSILIATERDGFYSLDFPSGDPEDLKIERIYTQNDDLFTNIDIFNIELISPNLISLGTWGYGLVLIDSLYNVVAVIDKSAGLQDEILQGQFLDETGNLWLALSNGISRVEIQSNITQFNEGLGIEGTVQSIIRFNNRIYATTNIGLFYMDQEYYNNELCDFSEPVFKPVEDFGFECWEMMVYRQGSDEVLLIISNDEVYELTKSHQSKVILTDFSYTLYPSVVDPHRVYIGLESGLKSIYRQDGKWVEEELLPGIEEMIIDIDESTNGDLWLCTQDEGILNIEIGKNGRRDLADIKVNRYSSDEGLPDGPFNIVRLNNAPLFATNRGLFSFDEERSLFSPDSSYGAQFADGSWWIHRISEFTTSGAYMLIFSNDPGMKFEVGHLGQESDGSWKWFNQPFSRISEELNFAIFKDSEETAWFGGSQGIFRYQPEVNVNYSRDFNAYVRSVESGEGDIIFHGAFPGEMGIQSMVQSKSSKYSLPYKENSLVFTYSAQPGIDESFNQFSYFLVGNDKGWSDWTRESKKGYTNLHEGEYLFRVKAKNIYGHISRESDYAFTILAPWYRTVWAYIVYVVIAALVVYTIVILYTRRLRAIIRERTAEVVAQKEVIQEKNNDIMDSILYAEKIQRAMLPPDDDLVEMGLDGFILFMPLNIVSGDFYWLGRKDGKIITVAADCTGHGVPGAFMSMLGVAFLNNIVGAKGIVSASAILDELRAEVIAALKQKGHQGEQKDGMDLALHIIDYERMKIEFAGANNPMILVRDQEIIQFKADRMPIGIHERAHESFQNQVMDIRKGDVIYTFSDGYQDQFGGPANKKFMIKRLKELLLEIHSRPMDEQKAILEKTFYDWIVPYGADQIDDVIVIGIRI